MKYSNIIEGFTWSFSRIKQFEMCPYGFLLKYIKHTRKEPMFFSSYGSFMHKLIERYLKGELPKEKLVSTYLADFRKEVQGKAPSVEVFKNYFEQGIRYLENIDFPYTNPLGVEHKVRFSIGDKDFIGVID